MKIRLILLMLFMQPLCFGQHSFELLHRDLEQKIAHSDFKNSLTIINSARNHYHGAEKNELDVMKVKILTEFGLYDESFKLSQILLSASEITEEQKLKIHVERALIFEINDNAASCFSELEKARAIFSKNPELKAKNYTNFLIRKSSYYRVNGYLKKANELAMQAKNYATAVNDQVNMPVVELILGLGTGNPQTELLQYRRALYLYKKLNHYEAVISLYCNLGNFHLARNEIKTAESYIDSALAISSKSNVLEYKADVFQIKSKLLEREKKADSALFYYKAATALYNKHSSEQRDLKIRELEIGYNVEKEKSEKLLLKKDVKTTRTWNAVLFISVFALAFFTWQITKNKRKIEEQKKKISQSNSALQTNLEEKQFLVQELNHRVKNNLAVILSLIDFQKGQEEDANCRNRFDDLHQRIKTIIIAHELYSYSVNYNDNALIEAPDYLNKIIESHQKSTLRDFQYISDIEPAAFNVDKILSLGLLVNELATNSIKHADSGAKKLVLHLKLAKTAGNAVELNYWDNGTVFNFENNKGSLGLLIIEGMVKQLKGNYAREQANYKITFPND